MAKKNVTRAKSNETAELDALYKSVMTCQPALSPSLVNQMAALIKDNDQMGLLWRTTAVLAGKDGEFFKQVATDVDTARVMAHLINDLGIFSRRLKTMKKLADAVSCRLMVAGCTHAKFNDWTKEAV